MSVVHFKLAHNGKTHRFAPVVADDQLFSAVKERVAAIVNDAPHQLFTADGEAELLLDNEFDFASAVFEAKFAGELSNKPPCVHLVVEFTASQAVLDEMTATAMTSLFAKKPEEKNNVSLRQMLACAIEKKQVEMDKMIMRAEELDTLYPELQLVVVSFRVAQEEKETTLTLHFNDPIDFTMWRTCLAEALSTVGLPEHCLAIHRDTKLTVTVKSAKFGDFLAQLKPVASRTNFKHARLHESSVAECTALLEGCAVQQITVPAEAKEFDHWLNLLRAVKASKVRVNRQNQKFGGVFGDFNFKDFLLDAADLVDSMWIGGYQSKTELTPSIVREILSRKCSYLHVRDAVTKIGLEDAQELVQFFQWGLKNKMVSLAIPTYEASIDTRIGKYRVKMATGSKYTNEKDLMIIEHVDMDPKAEKMC